MEGKEEEKWLGVNGLSAKLVKLRKDLTSELPGAVEIFKRNGAGNMEVFEKNFKEKIEETGMKYQD